MLADNWPVMAKWLRDQRRALLLWAIGLALVVAMYSSSYNPETAEEMSKSIPSGLSDALSFDDLASGAGFLTATVYGLLTPLLLLVFSVIVGTKAIAGEEEAGTLDLYLTYPISRGRLLLQRFAAITVALVLFGVLVWAEVSLLAGSLDMDVSTGNVAAATLGIVQLASSFVALAVCLGALTGKRAVVVGVTAAVAVAAYLMNVLAPQIDGLHFLQKFSPFYYAQGHQPLRNGFDVVDIVVLLAIPVVLLAIGLATFRRRDINV